MKISNLSLNKLLPKQFIFTALFTSCVFFGTYESNAQVSVSDFETFTLAPNSAFSPTLSTRWQTTNASFGYEYDFGFWIGGFVYTNVQDSSNGTFSNLYGVRAYKGVNNSSKYAVGQDQAVINTTAIAQTTVAGFYVTNTTYAYKSMAKGDAFARKFGDTTGTGSGTTIPQGSYPDFFRLVVKGYKNGFLKNDSVVVMLADYTFTNNAQDYILNTWQFVNSSMIGEVDSLQFFMSSSDNSFGFMNTPAFFAIDNFTTGKYNLTQIEPERPQFYGIDVFPNPFNDAIVLNVLDQTSKPCIITINDGTGKIVYSLNSIEKNITIDLKNFESGIYLLEIICDDKKTTKKLVKD